MLNSSRENDVPYLFGSDNVFPWVPRGLLHVQLRLSALNMSIQSVVFLLYSATGRSNSGEKEKEKKEKEKEKEKEEEISFLL